MNCSLVHAWKKTLTRRAMKKIARAKNSNMVCEFNSSMKVFASLSMT